MKTIWGVGRGGGSIPESSKSKLCICWQLFKYHLHYIYNYLHSMYIIVSIIDYLSII